MQLIRPPFDDWYDNKGQLTDLIAPPIGLHLIAAAIEGAEVIDGLDGIVPDLHGDIVGVTEDYSRHLNALNLLREAKDNGATTFLGGPNVTYLAKNILRNHPFVDYVVVGDGEEALPAFVNGVDRRNIPNLVYRDNGRIVANARKNAPLITLFDLDNYESGAIPLSMIRGCVKAESSGRCSFCSIDHSLKVMDPSLGWEQVKRLNEKHGATYFWETGDSFIVGDFASRFLALRPKSLSHVQFRVYVRPDQLDSHNAQVLSALNVKSLYIGIESGSNSVLSSANKGCSLSDIRNSLDLAEKYSLPIHVPFMLGLPGTTYESLESDYRLAEEISSRFPEMMMIVSLPVLFPGTQLFNNVRDNYSSEYPGDLYNDDFFDYRKLFELNVKHFTSVDMSAIDDVYDRMRGLVKKDGNFTSFALNR
jgi:anaerobic magnesium-protoporphyrin IX monomethyl ester cyclase